LDGTGSIKFFNAPAGSAGAAATVTERIRIDSSGNLLVGKTSASGSTAGAEMRAAGTVIATVDGDYPLYLNRLTSDGDIAQFRINGTTVGSIGTGNTNRLFIGSGDTSIMFDANNNAIYPWNITAASPPASDQVDLGYDATGLKFKNLYLGGGVYLGGTGSANLLDDHEEGTWTPTVGGTATYLAQSGRYVKIGGLVHIVFDFTINAIGTGSQAVVSGLPYAAFNTTAGSIGYYSGLPVIPVFPTFYVTSSQTIQFGWNTSGSATIQNNGGNFLSNSSRVIGSCTYYTSS